MTFANPEYFWLLLLVPLLAWWYVRKGRKSYTDIRVPTLLALRVRQARVEGAARCTCRSSCASRRSRS